MTPVVQQEFFFTPLPRGRAVYPDVQLNLVVRLMPFAP
jgi:hypothetical protein